MLEIVLGCDSRAGMAALRNHFNSTRTGDLGAGVVLPSSGTTPSEDPGRRDRRAPGAALPARADPLVLRQEPCRDLPLPRNTDHGRPVKYVLMFVDTEQFAADLASMDDTERERAYGRVRRWSLTMTTRSPTMRTCCRASPLPRCGWTGATHSSPTPPRPVRAGGSVPGGPRERVRSRANRPCTLDGLPRMPQVPCRARP